MTLPSNLPKKLRAVALGTLTPHDEEIYLTRAQLSRLLGVSEITARDWWLSGKLTSSAIDADGKALIPWRDIAHVVCRVIGHGTYPGLLTLRRPGSKSCTPK